MTKLKLSTAAQRQIPEFIKDNYPNFVEFIKAYYEFLQQTQERNLEGYRDIDSTLDEFLDRFKSELAESIPVSLAQDKRAFLRNIREFYLSRGSEQSYKFLFKTLFGKDATLFYPSTQMLRASDGKWIQDISIFVRTNDPSKTLFPMIGKFVNINTGDRLLEVYVSNVVEYESDIYELSILKDITNRFITIGSTVSLIEGENRYVGSVLKTPSKISVYKRGKGFKLGDIFSLKTDLGEGCIVKVTKIDSEGGIVAVSAITFGLHYETKFWSYLAPGEIEGFEFISPLEIWSNGVVSSDKKITTVSKSIIAGGKYRVTITTEGSHNLSKGTKVTIDSNKTGINGTFTIDTVPALNSFTYLMTSGPTLSSQSAIGTVTQPYEDGSKGFVEYGYASKQTYFGYDSAIPIKSGLGKESDRYYADSSYVGEIEAQFYADQSAQNLSDNFAIIEVDVGAIATYPGYYGAADGFISDECFIQDGDYYQAFSYVVRVEEELNKYYTLVKSILHPAGMKLFAEYYVFNNIDVTFIEPLTTNVLQFSDSITGIIDRGFNYNNYVNTIENSGEGTLTTLDVNGNEQTVQWTINVNPFPGAAVVNSTSGKSALFPYKPVHDYYTFTQIAGRVNSLNEETSRNAVLALNPSSYFPGHDVINHFDVEKNESPSSLNLSLVEYNSIGTNLITAFLSQPSAQALTVGDKIRIHGAGQNSNIKYQLNGLWTITEINNSLSFDFTISESIPSGVYNTDVGALSLEPQSSFNNYELASSSGYGRTLYDNSIDSLGNPTAVPSSGAAIIYTRSTSFTLENDPLTVAVESNKLWKATPVNLSDPLSYKSHVGYYFSINSSPRVTMAVTSLVSTGSNLITAIVSSTAGVMIGDVVRISGATGAPRASFNGTWIVVSVSSNSFDFYVIDNVTSGIYNTNIGTLVRWTPNPRFTDYTPIESSSYGYSVYNNSIDSIGNTSASFDSLSAKQFTRTTSTLTDSSSQPYTQVTSSPSSYASRSAYHMQINSSPRTLLPILSYTTNGTTTVTATLSSGTTSGYSVGERILIRGATGTSLNQRANLNGVWTIAQITTATSFAFVVESAIPSATHTSEIGTVIKWNPHPKFNEAQTSESVGYSYTEYVNNIVTTPTTEIVYSGLNPNGGQITIYATVDSAPGAQKVYSGLATATLQTDSSNQTYTTITNNSATSSAVESHAAKRLNKVTAEVVPQLEEGRVVLNAYNEEAEWQNGYYLNHSIVNGSYVYDPQDYEANYTIPYDGTSVYLYANKV